MEKDGVFAEGDFIVANPKRGLLVLEVKGGSIEQRIGIWFQKRQNFRLKRPVGELYGPRLSPGGYEGGSSGWVAGSDIPLAEVTFPQRVGSNLRWAVVAITAVHS